MLRAQPCPPAVAYMGLSTHWNTFPAPVYKKLPQQIRLIQLLITTTPLGTNSEILRSSPSCRIKLKELTQPSLKLGVAAAAAQQFPAQHLWLWS